MLIITYIIGLTTKQVPKTVLLPPCLIEHIPLSLIKMTKANKKASFPLRQLQIITACLSHNDTRKPRISKIMG